MFKATSENLAVGLLFVVIAALACFSPIQSDTWWLLRAGQDIWRTGNVPLRDSYSFTAAGQYWPNHEWLTEAIFYPLFRLGGAPLLTACCAAAIVATWRLSWRLSVGAFELRFLLFAACLASSTVSWSVRPQVLTMAFFMVTCAGLLNNRIRWLPLLFVVWANAHGAVSLGVVTVMAALCADVITHRKIRWPLVLVAGACVGATFISPLGARLWSFIPASMERSQVNQLIEWQAPGGSPGLWPFWAVAVALPIATVVWRRRLDERTMKLTAIALVLLPLALRAIRNVPPFLLVAVPAMTALARRGDAVQRGGGLARENLRLNAAILTAAAAGAGIVVALAWMAPAPSLGWRPIGSEAAAAVSTCGEPLYNTYDDGGVLIWFAPSRKVFIDNRQDPYPLPLLQAAHQVEITGDYEGVFSQFGIRCAALPRASPTAQRLATDAGWRLKYGDARWILFTRSSPR